MSRTAEFNDDESKIILRFEGSDFKRTLKLVKTLPERQFIKRYSYWTVPTNIDVIIMLEKWSFDLSKDLKEAYQYSLPKPLGVTEEIEGFGVKLYPFQVEAVEFIESKKGRVLLAEEMGCGKTLEILAWTALHHEIRPIICIVPSAVKINWKREIMRGLGVEAKILYGRKNIELGESREFYIINYEILSYRMEQLKELNPKMLIIDETHAISNYESKRTQAILKLADGLSYLAGLTGTPITNRPRNFYTILKLLNPDFWSSYWQYLMTYCGAKKNYMGFWDFNGKSNTDILHDLAVSSVMLRRLKKDVMKDLPPVTRSMILFDDTDIKEYKKLIREYRTEKLTIDKIERMKQAVVHGKLKAVIKWIDNFLESDEKLVVACIHHSVTDILVDKYKKIAVKLDGRDNEIKKQEAIDKFQTDKKIQMIFIGVKSGGVGTNLTAACNMVIIELPWRSIDVDQVEARIDRIGQTKPCNIYYLLVADTIEQKIAEIIDEKREGIHQIIEGEEVEETYLLTQLIEYVKEGK